MRYIAAFVAGCIPASALAAPIATGSAPGVPWLRLIMSLLACLAIAFGAIVALKRHQRQGIANSLAAFVQRSASTQRAISLIETRRASAHGDLCLVECEGERWLLAFTPSGVTVLKGPGTER